MESWLTKDVQRDLAANSLIIPMVKGAGDVIQNPFLRRLAQEIKDPFVTYIEVPQFANHVIHAAWSDVPGFGIDSYCYGYFASQHENFDWTWEQAEHDYFKLTDKSGMQWHMPEKPESKPFLAVIRLTGGQLTAANAAMPGPDWLADVESAIGFLLMKTFSEWGSRL